MDQEANERRGPERWLSKRELARHYGFSVRWVEQQTAEGMPSQMIGRQRRYRLSKTDAFLGIEAAS